MRDFCYTFLIQLQQGPCSPLKCKLQTHWSEVIFLNWVNWKVYSSFIELTTTESTWNRKHPVAAVKVVPVFYARGRFRQVMENTWVTYFCIIFFGFISNYCVSIKKCMQISIKEVKSIFQKNVKYKAIMILICTMRYHSFLCICSPEACGHCRNIFLGINADNVNSKSLFWLSLASRPGRVMVLMCLSVCVCLCVPPPRRSLDL